MLARLWTYQRERFPLVSHGFLIAAFSASDRLSREDLYNRS